MKKNAIKYEILRMITNTIYVIITLIGYGYYCYKAGALKWFDLDFGPFILRLGLSLFLYLVAILIGYFTGIIIHELGHLIFGLRAKLYFDSFNVLNISIIKEKKKLKLVKLDAIPGAKGYCKMLFDEKIKYKEKDIIMYYLGGIIFNILSGLFGVLILLISTNTTINFFISLITITYFYLALYNLIPCVELSGMNTDALHIKNLKNDPEHLKLQISITKINDAMQAGKELSTLDEKLFYKPKSLSTNTQVIMAQLYVSYLCSKENYKECIKYGTNLLEKELHNLTLSDVNTLKLDIIEAIFEGNYPLEDINKYWDEELEKYIDLMTNFYPPVLCIKYLYYGLVKVDKNKSKEIFKLYEQKKKKYPNKKMLKESDELMKKINKKIG